MNLTELKAAVYDQLTIKELAQMRINHLNQEIDRLEQEQSKEPATESKPVKVEETKE